MYRNDQLIINQTKITFTEQHTYQNLDNDII